MKLVFCLLSCVFIAVSARSLEHTKGLPQFAGHWLQVCHMFLDHEGETMLDLLELDPIAVEQLGKLWRHKAFRDTVEYQKHMQESYAAQRSRTLEEKGAAISESLDWMMMAYYYDHAKEIEAMIQRRLDKARKAQPAAEKK